MPIPDQPMELRVRARSLRTLATELERTPAMSLDQDAGPDTWQLPRGHACLAGLLVHQAHLHQAADDLRWLAHRLDARAHELEVARLRDVFGWGAG